MSLWFSGQSRSLWRLGDQWILAVDPIGPQTYSGVIYPVLKCVIGVDILRDWFPGL